MIGAFAAPAVRASRVQCVSATSSRKAGSCAASEPSALSTNERAVEHQFVLAADLIDVKQRQTGFRHARDRDAEPLLDDLPRR